MTAGRGRLVEQETAQEILDELLRCCRIEGEEKARYRKRLGNALLMEAMETTDLYAKPERGESDA